MAKRSREDYEPSSSDSESAESPLPSAVPIVRPGFRENRAPSPKIAHLDTSSGEASTATTTAMRCSLPGHRQTVSFPSYEEYEIHYSKTHMNRCLECRKNFPTEHFLSLHIQENHDALIEVRKERGEKTYACFVEDCDRVCSTPQKRRFHLIDKHMYPKDYDFYVVNDGIDGRSSMLRSGRHRRRSSAAQHMTNIDDRARRRHSKTSPPIVTDAKEDQMPSEEDPMMTPPTPKSKEDEDMDGLTGAMSALKFIPPSVRFGRSRGRGRGGFSRS
ncbi:hypothetical protein BP5796_08682 [Coleophoma crateriformis]|uniref:C2H2-type domain-containing protein n=1 Tax=Coleophoma crateriformis TaxID=565419 RepID=A0A3D8R8B2_9HELO|nr:hypothetical protein BP5796_08682 [Coleophoma crateriformis]